MYSDFRVSLMWNIFFCFSYIVIFSAAFSHIYDMNLSILLSSSFLMLINWTTFPEGTLTTAIFVLVLPIAWTDASLCCTTYISGPFVTIMRWCVWDTVCWQLWASLFFSQRMLFFMNIKAFKHVTPPHNRWHCYKMALKQHLIQSLTKCCFLASAVEYKHIVLKYKFELLDFIPLDLFDSFSYYFL